MNTIAYFEIQATDPHKLVVFYHTVFGWKITKDEQIPIEYYRIETEGIGGAILKRPVPVPPQRSGTNAFTCSIEVSHFDETAKKILDNGGIVAMSKFAIPNKCWQGYFLDTDNNVFGIFEVDEKAK
ncbi:MAG: VOC family protein [Patescibacteria group bacterium]